MSEQTMLPVPTPEQTTQGVGLYRTLGMVVQSYQDWFAEGIPSEWVRALEHIQQTLTRCKRDATQAAQQQGKPTPGQAELFAAGHGGGGGVSERTRVTWRFRLGQEVRWAGDGQAGTILQRRWIERHFLAPYAEYLVSIPSNSTLWVADADMEELFTSLDAPIS